ncbi:MAG: hypothetical protein HYT94_03210 [Parcubacteria group bacterium]|nr:hypothetical protein [Parcubacteria group bacterium]
MSQVKFVFICAGRKHGLCFPAENAEKMWKHLKGYKRREGYAHVKIIKEVACLGVCKDGPCLLVIDENGKDTSHSLGAEMNLEKAKQLLDSFMDEYVIDTTPPPGVK